MEDKNETPYKVEPETTDARETIDKCREVADKFKIQSFGEIECPIPSEVE